MSTPQISIEIDKILKMPALQVDTWRDKASILLKYAKKKGKESAGRMQQHLEAIVEIWRLARFGSLSSRQVC